MKNKLFLSSLVFFLLSFNQIKAQVEYDFGFVRHDSISVFDSLGIQLQMPWVGGLNSVHFQEIDLDIDGVMDLVVFDVHGNKLYPFINEGDSNQTKYNYKPEYVKLFPNLLGWVQCVDYNGDGNKDLYTYVPGGIALYKNVSTPASGLVFQMVSPMLNYMASASFPINIFVTEVDFPAIADIDFDGDIDILAFHILGSFVIYYKNMSMELYGDKDHLDFKEADRCWGKFAESEEINSIYLNTYCYYKNSDYSSKSTKHTGSTMLPINLNGDSLMDLILGDVDFFTLNGLINGGNQDTALIVSQDTLFPSYDTSVNMVTFPLASYMDIDNDGIKELIVSPFESAYYKPEAINSVWLYENSGSNDNPNFHLTSKNYFQSEMIEVGDNATPEIVDVDGDGLMDIVVTSYGIVDSTYFDMTWFILWTHKSSSMTWYKNIGTVSQPAFKYMDGNIFNLRSLKLTATKSTFGDLDGDDDLDMILGSSDGKLLYFENVAGPDTLMRFAPPSLNFANIDVDEYSAPDLFDIDGDSLLDLVVGQKSGWLSYFKNTGTKYAPVFTKQTDSMGNVRVISYWNYYTGYSIPEIYKDDRDSLVMMVGSASGSVFYFRDIANNVFGTFGMDSNLLYTDYVDTLYSVAYFMNEGNILEYMGVGMRSAPAVYDFNNDGFKDMVVGNFSGGLNYFKGSVPTGVGIKQSIPSSLNFRIYPNPASNYIIISFSTPVDIKQAYISLYNSSGQIVAERILNNPSTTRLNFDYLPTGVYFISVKTTDFNGIQQIGSSKVLIVNN
jgi:hypothetical protein